MTSIFDGVAGVIAGVFGAPVTYTPVTGQSRVVRCIFREGPEDVQDDDGHLVRAVGPHLKVRRSDAPALKRGDMITIADGRVFEVQAVWPGGSPASDGFLHADLFQVPA